MKEESARSPIGKGDLLRPAQTWRRRLVIFTLVVFDVLLALSVWAGASLLQSVLGNGQLTSVAAVSIVPNAAVWVGMRALFGLYPGYGLNQAEELKRQSYAAAATLAITAVFGVALQVGDLFSRMLLVSGFLGLALLAPLARQLAKLGMRLAGIWGKPVAILHADRAAANVVRALRTEWGLGMRPVVFFDDRRDLEGTLLEGVPYGGTVTHAGEVARWHGVDTAILSSPQIHDSQFSDLFSRASSSFRNIIVIPNLGRIAYSAVVARDMGGIPGMEIKHNLLDPSSQRLKRSLELVATVVGGLFVLPLICALALLVRLESPGPIFFRAQRLGRDGRVFPCVKYRTMATDAEERLLRLLEDDATLREEYRRYRKLREDPRVTRVGRFLRSTSLDELPQLWNVLLGQMSLVGPRPYLPREAEEVGEHQQEILRVRPGLTGFWQVSGRNLTSFEERVQMDAYYVRNWSVWLDLVILARTVSTVIFRRGAH